MSKDGRTELAQLSARDSKNLTDDEVTTRVQLEREFGSLAAAQTLARSFLQTRRNMPALHFELAYMLYVAEDIACLDHFEATLPDPELRYSASYHATAFCVSNELDEALTDGWRNRLCEEEERSKAEASEMELLHPDDALTSPDLDTDLAKTIVARMNASGTIRRAWIAQKPLKLSPDRAAYAVAFKFGFFRLPITEQSMIAQAIAEMGEIDSIWLLPLKGAHKGQANRISSHGVRIK